MHTFAQLAQIRVSLRAHGSLASDRRTVIKPLIARHRHVDSLLHASSRVSKLQAEPQMWPIPSPNALYAPHLILWRQHDLKIAVKNE